MGRISFGRAGAVAAQPTGQCTATLTRPETRARTALGAGNRARAALGAGNRARAALGAGNRARAALGAGNRSRLLQVELAQQTTLVVRNAASRLEQVGATLPGPRQRLRTAPALDARVITRPQDVGNRPSAVL